MSSSSENTLEQLNAHLNSPRRTWLFGAGVSCNAGIPLMAALTTRVRSLLNAIDAKLYDSIYDSLSVGSHIEHVLSQIGDLISLAERSKSKNTQLGGVEYSSEALREFHATLLIKIGETVKYGYRPASDSDAERVGTSEKPIVSVDNHMAFVRAIFSSSQAGLESQRPPISFFTTNYDTLLEDALALARIPYVDGFVGGASAFWAPESAYGDTSDRNNFYRARVYKLHGSVDWYLDKDGEVVRCRDGCAYPDRAGNLLIYPQSTKYVATQKDPFAGVFSRFRRALDAGPDNVLIICGYSFGDEHVNGEIHSAMSSIKNKTVILAFAAENDHGIPSTLKEWLECSLWKERLFVATDKGLYHGSLENLMPVTTSPHAWWTFQGLTELVRNGPPHAEQS